MDNIGQGQKWFTAICIMQIYETLLDISNEIRVTIKYRSKRPTRMVVQGQLVEPLFALVIFIMSFYKKMSEIQGKITGPWYIDKSDLQIVWGQTEHVYKVWCISKFSGLLDTESISGKNKIWGGQGGRGGGGGGGGGG